MNLFMFYVHISGVEMKFKNMKYPVMIAPTHIPELVDITHTDLGIRFGASVTLSRIDQELKQAIDKYPGMYLIQLYESSHERKSM